MKPNWMTPEVIAAAKPVWGAHDKVLKAMRGHDVEPDRFDDLNSDRAFACDLAKDRWCPPPARRRLVAYIEKIDVVLRSVERHGNDDG